MLKKVLTKVCASFSFLIILAGSALAEEGAAMATMGGHNEYTVKTALALAAGFCLALAAFGGALGQSKAAAAALEGIARNPGAKDKVQTPMIIGLALIESLVIYALVISFILIGKI